MLVGAAPCVPCAVAEGWVGNAGPACLPACRHTAWLGLPAHNTHSDIDRPGLPAPCSCPFAVGGSPSDRATLAEPQSGSLVLAGEAASVAHPATVHGAFLSGQEAAYRVLDAARELPQCGSAGGSSSSGSGGACVVPPPLAAGSSPQCDCEQPGSP